MLSAAGMPGHFGRMDSRLRGNDELPSDRPGRPRSSLAVALAKAGAHVGRRGNAGALRENGFPPYAGMTNYPAPDLKASCGGLRSLHPDGDFLRDDFAVFAYRDLDDGALEPRRFDDEHVHSMAVGHA